MQVAWNYNYGDISELFYGDRHKLLDVRTDGRTIFLPFLPCPTWQPPPERLAATARRSVRACDGL